MRLWLPRFGLYPVAVLWVVMISQFTLTQTLPIVLRMDPTAQFVRYKGVQILQTNNKLYDWAKLKFKINLFQFLRCCVM